MGEEAKESKGGGNETPTTEREEEESRDKLVAHIGVPVTDVPEDVKAESEKTRSKQVPQRCQVWDAVVVRVEVPAPDPVHHPVGNVQQDDNLGCGKERAASATNPELCKLSLRTELGVGQSHRSPKQQKQHQEEFGEFQRAPGHPNP